MIDVALELLKSPFIVLLIVLVAGAMLTAAYHERDGHGPIVGRIIVPLGCEHTSIALDCVKEAGEWAPNLVCRMHVDKKNTTATFLIHQSPDAEKFMNSFVALLRSRTDSL